MSKGITKGRAAELLMQDCTVSAGLTNDAWLSSEDPATEDHLDTLEALAAPTPADVKESNPKDAIGIRKVPYSTLPTPVLAECGVAMLEGAIKYGRHNYRAIGVRASVYYDAVVARHLASWWEGEDTDEDSGISHISKAIAGLMVLRDAQIRGKMVDDRPVGTKGFIKALNAKVDAMMARLPAPKEAFVANGQPQDEYQP